MNAIPMNHTSRQILARGVAVALAVLASVTGLFAQASSMPWLADTPVNMAAMQRCEQVRGTAARRACAEAVVASVLAHDLTPRLAQAGPEAQSRASSH